MDERTLTALKGSIAKWEGIVAGTVENRGFHNCPLCARFHPEATNRSYRGPHVCEGCPVKDKTGKSLCRGSPYYKFEVSPNQSVPKPNSISSAVYCRMTQHDQRAGC